jgi:hypothetical protein
MRPPAVRHRPQPEGGESGMTAEPRNELEPAFVVTVTLDGDDWPPTQTENAKAALETALAGMVTVRLIRAYTIEVAP